MALKEFECIQQFFASNKNLLTGPSVVVPTGDDGAIVQVPEGEQLVLTTDTLVSGVHFLEDAPPKSIGHKVLAVNLSDLAAMGATPQWILMALTLPEMNEAWLAEFAEGFRALAENHKVLLVGGDLTHGPLSITLQALGTVPAGKGLLRSGATVGDGIYVSGTLGGAAYGLNQGGDLSALHYPTPRVSLGLALRGIASSCVDISDGLVADCEHLCEASGVSALIEQALVPLPSALDGESVLPYALTGGDDYELCFTAPVNRAEDVLSAGEQAGVSVTRIGTVMERAGSQLVTVLDEAGSILTLHEGGYQHF